MRELFWVGARRGAIFFRFRFRAISCENAFLFIISSRESRELIGDIFIGTVAADPEENGLKQVFLKVSLRKNIYIQYRCARGGLNVDFFNFFKT